MCFIIAPDKFKGCMSASEASACIEKGIKNVLPQAELLLFPLSDGGEGLVESLTGAEGNLIKKTTLTGPLGKPVEASFGIIDNGNTAVIEMAAASGLSLLTEEERNPSITTTYGTGELIRTALDQKCKKLIIGIGGSATNDGGAGMAQALGAELLDKAGQPLGFGGAELLRLDNINISGLDSRLRKVDILVASDVDNLLTGPHGAAYTYGPQKGASAAMVNELDQALKKYARIIKRDLGLDVGNIQGSGAAGGLGAGFIAFLKAKLNSGIELVLDTLNLEQYLPNCNLLITGEGKLDAQSAHGKAPVGVARKAGSFQVPVIALAGSIEGNLDIFHREGISACFSIADGPLSLQESISRGPQLLETKTAELFRLWNLTQAE